MEVAHCITAVIWNLKSSFVLGYMLNRYSPPPFVINFSVFGPKVKDKGQFLPRTGHEGPRGGADV